MTASPPASQERSSATAASPAESDASCRLPVLFLLFCSTVWLLISAGLGLVASLTFHVPSWLADTRWLTYGRVQPAASNALIYGFAVQAGLSVALWLIARLGRTQLRLGGIVLAGALVWNAGVKIGLLGILFGDSTGQPALEMPGYASPLLFAGYALIGLGALITWRHRREAALYPSQWFLLAALFWFPWIYSTASLLLVVAPVRGIMQAVVSWWYVQNLYTVWLGFVGLATLFFLIPRLVNRPLYSQYHAMIAFWLLALFGGWGGIPHGAPVPAWMPSLSTVSTVFCLVPLFAVAANLHRTLAGQYAGLRRAWPLPLAVFGAAAYVLSSLLGVAASLPGVSDITEFTFFTPARTHLYLCGFLALTLFSAVYFMVPRLLDGGLPSVRLTRVHAWCAVLGILLSAVPLLVGGVLQGLALAQPAVEPMAALRAGLMALRLSTLGDLLWLVGQAALVGNLSWALVRSGRASCAPVWAAAMRPESAEAAS